MRLRAIVDASCGAQDLRHPVIASRHSCAKSSPACRSSRGAPVRPPRWWPRGSSTSQLRPVSLAAVALLAGALVTAQAIATGPALSGVEGPALSDAQAQRSRRETGRGPVPGSHSRDRGDRPEGWRLVPRFGSLCADAEGGARALRLQLFLHDRRRRSERGQPREVRRAADLLESPGDRRAPGEGAARFRGRWQGAARTPLGVVLFPEFATLRRPAGRAVRAARDRRVHRGIRQSLAPGAGGAAAVPGLGRDLRSHETRSGSHRPDGADRRRGPRAVDVGPHPRKRPRFLHGLWARRASVGPSELPRAHEERDDLGDWG